MTPGSGVRLKTVQRLFLYFPVIASTKLGAQADPCGANMLSDECCRTAQGTALTPMKKKQQHSPTFITTNAAQLLINLLTRPLT